MRARDQHLMLRPEPFLAYLRHAGSLLRNASAWQAAALGGTTHGYPVPGGLVLGPLGVRNMSEFLATGGGRVIPM
ncbi:hypothetical protein TSOC_010336 [Tetrabaena socialis]|uniref:Uncharacterized protein n=1 Tax=Tetrabaena socialis TaxID=47790 RepID=A0A2J7ZTJ8_9CHLO|nr:hypothetical protein TSOC_010336 [Tetrabaena socialis]|eukprot:PNH03593.1 hypothetical protein TSOC_010336 [Tetrabaena socialis]